MRCMHAWFNDDNSHDEDNDDHNNYNYGEDDDDNDYDADSVSEDDNEYIIIFVKSGLFNIYTNWINHFFFSIFFLISP